MTFIKLSIYSITTSYLFFNFKQTEETVNTPLQLKKEHIYIYIYRQTDGQTDNKHVYILFL